MIRFFNLTVALLSIFVLSIDTTYAQNGKALSLEECIDIALKKNSQLKMAGYELDASGAEVTSSYSSVLPRVWTTLQSGRIITDRRTFINNEFVSNSRNFHSFGVSFGWTLFDFGMNWNTIKGARSDFEARSQNLADVRQNVYATVKKRYLELLKAVNLEREYREAVERSEEQLQRTQSMYEIGSVAQIDVYRQEVTLGRDELNLINQLNTVKIAKGNLNVAMGRDPETPIEIKEVEPVTGAIQYSLEEAFAIAERNSPKLKQFEYNMESAEYWMKQAKADFWPSLGIGGSYSNTGEKPNAAYGTFLSDYQLSVGVQLTFDIFNGFADKAKISRQSANYSIAKENWTDTRRQTYLEVKQAYLNLKANEEISKINEKNLRAAEEEYRLAQERYRVGAGTQLEVTEAQVSLTSARVQLVSAKYDAMVAQAQLEAAMGMIETEK